MISTLPIATLLVLAAGTNPVSGEALDAYEAALRTPANLQPMSYGGGLEWTFEVEAACRIYIREYGAEDAEPWIVVHGGYGAEHSYLLDAFAGLESEVRLIFYDQRGSLRSHCPARQVTSDAHVDDIERLRVVMGLERINLVGHSMGTHLASRYLGRFGQSVDRVVLLAPANLRHPLTEADIEANPAAADNNAAAMQLMNRAIVEDQVTAEGLLDDESLEARQQDLKWRLIYTGIYRHNLSNWRSTRGGRPYYSEEAGQTAYQSQPETYDLVPALKAHSAPVNVIIGDHDYVDLGGGLYRHWF